MFFLAGPDGPRLTARAVSFFVSPRSPFAHRGAPEIPGGASRRKYLVFVPM